VQTSIYLGLFLSAFIAATLLPAFSELGFAAALTATEGEPIYLFLAVTTGNILGACVNWWLGNKASAFQNKRWFPFSQDQIAAASTRFHRHGRWSLFFAWVPVIGDPLTFISGVLKTPFSFFLLAVSIGKAARYAVIWWLIAAAQ
jgi:membrane protein YqaA with SNARE-associated domain